jgi:hypothetical protein
MDEQFDTPVENQVPSTEPTTPPEQGSEQQPQETTTTPEQNPGSDTAQQNNRNAQRRIRQRNNTNRRIAELERQLAEERAKNDTSDMSKFRQQSLADRIDDMQAMSQDADTNDFVDRATEFFGEDTDKFLQDTYRYAPYVNENEPDLLLYAQRQYGPVLLHEWYKRMDNPQLRQQWLQMTRYEKNMVLHKYYTSIEKIIAAYNNGQLKPPTAAPKTVPVPGGGRETPADTPSDDFGVEFQKAVARHSKRN